MKNANVVLFEDVPETREFVGFWLDKSNHTVTCEATSIEEALSAVEEIASGALPCDVALLDGNLELSTSNNHDALRIAKRIQELELGIKIIDFASIPLSTVGIKTDAICNKSHLSELPGIIDHL